MRKTVYQAVLAFFLTAPLWAQERREMREWPPELYSCVADGEILRFRTQFEPGRSEVLPGMRQELRAMGARVNAHAQDPEHCFLVFGAADTMRWRGEPRAWVNDGNDAVISLARAEAIGNLLGREFGVAPARTQVEIVTGELPRNTAIVLGRFFRRYAERPSAALDSLRARVEKETAKARVHDELVRKDIAELRAKDETLEEKDRQQDEQIADLDHRVSRSLRFGLAAGGGYDANRDYRMPRATVSLLFGTEAAWRAEVTAWYGRSPNETRETFTYRGEELTSDLYKWGYGGRVVAYIAGTRRFAIGPVVEGYKYESVIDALGEFAETKRGIAFGLAARVSASIVNFVGLVAYGPWDEFKKAAGVGGGAERQSGVRASVGLQISTSK